MILQTNCKENMTSLFSIKNEKHDEVSNRIRALEEKLLGYVIKTGGKEVRKFLPMDQWVYAVPGEVNSPKVMRVYDDILNIKFPPHSSDKYDHKVISRRKKVEIQRGCLFDKISGKKWSEGEMFEINPHDNVIPVTFDNSCLVKVTLL